MKSLTPSVGSDAALTLAIVALAEYFMNFSRVEF
jgi:hypothetical protein